MPTHKVVGKTSGFVYFAGTLDECEEYAAYEIAGLFEILPLGN